MTDRLEDIAARLRRRPPDRDLAIIEPLVWRRIDDERAILLAGRLSPGAALAAARLSFSALALVGGLLAGMAAVGPKGPETNELAVFSTQAPFGFSSLLSRS